MPPSITILLDTIIYMHMHIQNLVVYKNKKKSHGKSCPGTGTLLNQHSDPPPLLGFFVSGFFFCFFFQNFVADKNK